MKVEELSQFKFYLKIISISYFPHNISQKCLSSSNVKNIIKQNQIFDNVILTSKLQVIKISLKSDISIIWINIWNVQSVMIQCSKYFKQRTNSCIEWHKRTW